MITFSDLSAIASPPEDSTTTDFASQVGNCRLDSRISNDIKLRPESTASNFTDMGKAEDIHRCIGRCCARPSCDIAYLLNDKCFAVQCLDGVLCQTSAEPASLGANVKLAYMNRGASGQKEKGKCEVWVTRSLCAWMLLESKTVDDNFDDDLINSTTFHALYK